MTTSEQLGETARGFEGGFPFKALQADALAWREEGDGRQVNALLDEKYAPLLLDALLQAGAGPLMNPTRDRSFTGKQETAVKISMRLGSPGFWGVALLSPFPGSDGLPAGIRFLFGLPHASGPEMARQGFQEGALRQAYVDALFTPLPLVVPPVLESHGSLGRPVPLRPERKPEVVRRLQAYSEAWGASRKLQVYVAISPEELEGPGFMPLLRDVVVWVGRALEVLRQVTDTGQAHLLEAKKGAEGMAYELNAAGVRATGVWTESAFVVRAGSQARAQAQPSFLTHNYAKLRVSLIEEGRLAGETGAGLLAFQEDVSFDSASAAAAVVLGRAANGLKEWRRPGSGETLRASLAGVLPSGQLEERPFTWVPFFRALARRLLDFESPEGQLALLKVLREAQVNINHDVNEDLRVIDPYTFFSVILKSKSDARVRGFLHQIAPALGLEETVPEHFDGVPWSEPRSAWFFAYRTERQAGDLPLLWTLARQAVEGEVQAATFEAALRIRMVGVPRLTQGLYWLNPERYLPLNGVNVPYLDAQGVTGAGRVRTLAEYEDVMVQARNLGLSFPEVCHTAWLTGQVAEPVIRADGETLPESAFTPVQGVPLNQVLYGPPGTGKTYRVIEETLRILSPAFLAAHREPHQRDARKAEYDRLVEDGQVTFVTFHQSFTYEDFIEGLQPSVVNGQIEYRNRPGLFLEAVRRAGGRVREEDPEALPRAHVLVIDEINRGNVAKIFGELLTLLEDTKRAGASDALSVSLPVSRFPLSVPASLYVLGTMNTADRSLTQLDAALRRRFTFQAVWPDPALLPERLDLPEGELNLQAFLSALNDRIEERLSRDQLIGHAYLLNLPASLDAVAGAFRNRIIPLLEEYFFEDWPSIREVLGDDRKRDRADQFVHVLGEGERRRYRYNEGAFRRLRAYQGVYDGS